MKKVILSGYFILFAFIVAAQDKPQIKFEAETFDFGTIKEANGPADHKFEYTNTGKAPLVIQGVRSSCGCTTPSWTKDPVLPGEKGFITARYNPLHRPGPFRKSLTITSNADTPTKVLFIKGVVEPKPKTIADQYPNKIGAIRIRYRSLNMGKLTTDKPFTRSFNLYNDSDHDVKFLDKSDKPDYVQVKIDPQVLKPKETAKMMVTYDPVQKRDYGFVTDPLVIYTDEAEQGRKDLRLVATIEEYFPPLTPGELAEAPKLTFDKTIYDFGNIKKGDKVTVNFTLTNAGKNDLNIRKVKPNCGCTVSKLERDTLKPGESSTLEVTFNSAGRRGIQQKSINIFCNDPTAPTRRLIIKGKILEPGK